MMENEKLEGRENEIKEYISTLSTRAENYPDTISTLEGTIEKVNEWIENA